MRLRRPGHAGHLVRINGQAREVVGDAADQYFRGFVKSGEYADDITPFLAAIIRPHHICFDVGANIGLTSMFMAGVDRSVKVTAFEVAPRTAGFLEENVRRNGFAEQICVERLAISDEVGFADLVEIPSSASASYLKCGSEEHPLAVGLSSTTVPTTTIDVFVEQRMISRLDLLKIDVEGHESAALRGAGATLERLRPLVILEFNAWALVHLQKTDPQSFLDEVFRYFRVVLALGRGTESPRVLEDSIADRTAFLERCAASGFVDNLACEV
jgi:FkbM family methyltransferase